jgi:porphobilinogen synthase
VFHPHHRPRRLRASAAWRELTAEHRLRPAQFIQPLFVREGLSAPVGIPNMPGVQQLPEDALPAAAEAALNAGVRSVMVFGIPEHRDPTGSQATTEDNVLARAMTGLRDRFGPDLVLVADLCLDEFTDHGHCGVLDDFGRVDNDATIAAYGRMGVLLAAAGADLLGASGMMDGQVGAVRGALDAAGHLDTAILAYAAKYASAFYGPFRGAVESQLVGDRRTYQQDPANRREATREIELDLAEGADLVMVKPALAYLDVIADAARMAKVPVAAYVVSGELAMIELAAAAGAFDRRAAIMETLTGVRRAGADVICTYWATEVAGWIREES